MPKWNSTTSPGVRYREHPTRRNGIKKDQYFSIYYRLDGKRKEEGIGWASEGWTAKKAAEKLAKLSEAHREGTGPQTLKAAREKRRMEDEATKALEERMEKDSVTFADFWERTYFPLAKSTKKFKTFEAERFLFEHWILGVIGQKSFKSVSPFDLEKIKAAMLKAGRKPASVKYSFAVIRQVWNLARREGYVQGDCPTVHVKAPKFDNKRIRFLSVEESERLLEELLRRSRSLYDQALLSLYTGMRAGEVFALQWSDIDFERGSLTIRDPKNGETRTAFMVPKVREMLSNRKASASTSWVFIDKKGGQVKEVSGSFMKAVEAVGLNDGRDDSRQKVVFHTLRHTFASWLVATGTPIYAVSKLMGHKSIVMTERYSHFDQSGLKGYVQAFVDGVRTA